MINKDELLFVVDEDNNPQEPKPRQKVHEKGIWHRTAHIWISNSKKQILCQQRSLLKDQSPGMWEPFFGGHMPANTEYIDGALVELKEELGIDAKKEDLHQILIYKNEKAKEFQGVFHLSWNGDIDQIEFEKEEIQDIKWIDLEELKEILLIQRDLNWNSKGYMEEAFDYIERLF